MYAMANHRTQWKPEARVNQRTKQYDSYAELKRDLVAMLEESHNHEVSVSRSRRGEWGEWFEYWGFNYKRKPMILKQGWM